jgi:hypothetical protein
LIKLNRRSEETCGWPFLSVLLTSLALVPSGAHLFELPNKIGLSQDHYLLVQSIYRLVAVRHYHHRCDRRQSAARDYAIAPRPTVWVPLAAALILAGTLTIFFLWTYPANQATENWTVMTADWAELRRQWEFSHATNAVLTFIAVCCATLSALRSAGQSGFRSNCTAVLTPSQTLPHQGEGLKAHSRPHRWGRVGVGVMRVQSAPP